MPILEITGLRKTYTTRLGGNRVEALKNVSFTAEPGEYIAIMGESGSGKTTLLNILAALDKPTGGSVVLDGMDLAKIKESKLADFRRDNLGFVFQEFNLLDTFTVRDNILLPLVLRGEKYPAMQPKLNSTAELLGISALLDKYPYEISGGQKQRTAAARAMITEPKLLLADEPTGALDSRSSDELLALFAEINRRGQTILMVTHSAKAASPREAGAVHKGRRGVPPALPRELLRRRILPPHNRRAHAAVLLRRAAEPPYKEGGRGMKLYFRLAAGGIRRNSRLYVPYIMTCSLMVMMYYITDALSGDEMLSAMAGGYIMHELIVIGKVVMALFAAIFLFYTNSFLIKSRMREFGLYNILGMGKNGIARVMTWETLMVYVISMVFGLGAGILFSKLAELLAVKIVQGDAAYQFSVSGPAAAASLIVFAVIFLLICLNVLRQVFFSKPVELLRSENSGEKPPKANWFAAVLGALMLGLAYFMAVTIEEPLSAILAFMAAVLLVIAATYLLFVAGSVVLCRVLQKNKGYYYKTNHFISVSQMSYRMRKNGAGLASICILSTMVLVTLSTTICLYTGEEQILRQRYPRDMVTMTYGLPEEDIPAFRESVGALAEKHGASPKNVLAYSYADLSGAVIGNRLDMARGNSDDVSLDLRSVYVVPIADYNALYGTDIQLADGEAAAYFKGKGFGYDEIQLDDWGSYRITQRLGEFTITGTDSATIYDTIYLFVKDWSDLESLNDYQNRLTDEYGGMRSNIVYYYCFDLDCGEDSQLDFYYEMEYGDVEFPFHFERLKTECRARDHEEFLGLYGGLFFLGILFGGVFILAAVLIMYYKQISEGFNDRARFDILRKVGMNDREIRRAVNSQVLTVFFAPLIAAGIHMAFAFPLLTKILGLFSMRDAGFLAIVTLICFAVFAALYVAVYALTSRSYYRIVSGNNR